MPEAAIAAAEDSAALVKLNGEYKGQAINARQEAALLYLLHDGNPRITNSDLQTLCPEVHPETIRRDLADLVDERFLAQARAETRLVLRAQQRMSRR